ncbi:MAG: glycosyltransferase family 2 protein [Patescibacteria group bacterium]|nr:glycosyltransferase family 2 protein [Patescibacteria group bacterium]
MTAKQPKLTLVILNYNSQFWLKKTLTTLKQFYLDKTKTKVDTIVVDNASQDESVDLLKKEFKWVKLIKSEENLGFSAGNNLALRKIKSDYVMLLNNDIEFTDKSNLDVLLKFMDENKKVAVCTSQLNLADGSLDKACHRGEPTFWAAATFYLKLEKLFPDSKFFGQYHLTYKNMNKVHTIDACSGAAMMIRASAMDEIGLLDERFFMYAEDLDWCHRFRDKNYQIVYVPQVEIIHHKYKSGIKTESDLTSTQTKQYFYNTMLQYYDKHYKNENPRIYRFILKAFIFIKKDGL